MIILFIISDKHMYPSIPCIPISSRPTSLPFFHRAACEFSLVRGLNHWIPMFHHVSWASPSRKLSGHAELFLVGGKKNNLEKYERQGGRMTSHILWKIKTCLTPPTRYYNWDWFSWEFSGLHRLSIFRKNGYPTYSIVQLLFSPNCFLRDKPAWYIFLRKEVQGDIQHDWRMNNGIWVWLYMEHTP